MAPVFLPVISGLLRGWRWRLDCPGLRWSVLTGTADPVQTQALARLLQPGDTFLDVGADVGYYTLVAARMVGAEGCVAAFEGRRDRLTALRSHVEVNDLNQVVVEDSDEPLQLDDWCVRHDRAPQVIRMALDGAEVEALQSCTDLVEAYHPVFLLVTHGLDREEACRDLLSSYNYGFIALAGAVGDPDRAFLCAVDHTR